MRKIDIKGKSLWVYDKILESLLIACLLLAIAFTSTIEFLRQIKFKTLAKSLYEKPFFYFPKIDKPKKK